MRYARKKRKSKEKSPRRTIFYKFSILNSQLSILNSQFPILNSQFPILNSQFSILNSFVLPPALSSPLFVQCAGRQACVLSFLSFSPFISLVLGAFDFQLSKDSLRTLYGLFTDSLRTLLLVSMLNFSFLSYSPDLLISRTLRYSFARRRIIYRLCLCHKGTTFFKFI